MFLTGAVVDHFLFTDSSCARQLSMRQGTDKNKHLSDKIPAVGDGRKDSACAGANAMEPS